MRMIPGMLLAAAGVAVCVQGADIKIDFNAEMGKMKPVHATGQGPLWG